MNIFNRQKCKVPSYAKASEDRQSAKHVLDQDRGCKIESNPKFCNSRFDFCVDSGFTLVETLVAITILMIAIAGPLTVAEKGLSAAIYARDQLMASYLAQDGMEYLKNMVDNNQINIDQVTTGYTDTKDQWISTGSAENGGQDLISTCNYNPLTETGNVCTIDTLAPSIVQYSLSSVPILYLAPSYGYVEDNSGTTETPFTRYFYIQGFNINGASPDNNYDNSFNAATVVMTVTWPGDVTGGGGVQLEDTFYDTPLH